ncbi:hypothetical protein [Bacillus sonorensis]|uniref:hypothetical protein n=1 Tax=Bacillus sonorensis TaxID=119858 RepID=UPI000495B6D3|nr:hypothetical protein [Bacillus sonorensis]MCF7618519.1 hypothetical protein [Bacillus sonorensis]MCY8034190.1 hypothetical protein [Bacillus sonorensis]MCY8272826.1 hypothetical protein [Bacillus sonorensis]MCY8564329.1 hypothetical protein [Bacillus sonorensis]MCY8607249.1 hypothetical protein [Bacillus sonorensis]
MINTKFYDGFEGEPELILSDGENKLIIWNGYFETILDSLLDKNIEKEGIIKEYFNHEGWYDDSPWVIQDLDLTIDQMKSFDINTLDVSEDMKNVLPDIVKEIIQFLENAKNKTVVIEYD